MDLITARRRVQPDHAVTRFTRAHIFQQTARGGAIAQGHRTGGRIACGAVPHTGGTRSGTISQ